MHSLGNLVSLHQRLGEWAFRTTATWDRRHQVGASVRASRQHSRSGPRGSRASACQAGVLFATSCRQLLWVRRPIALRLNG